MHISQHGLDFTAGFEGGQSADGLFRAYWDRWGRVWTIGYGETEGVRSGMVWTRAQAEDDLRTRMVREYEPSIATLGVPLNQNEWDALCDIVWNLGTGAMQWDIGRFLRASNYQAAADAMLEYVRAGGVVLAGLVRRRHTDRQLFLTPVKPTDPYRYHVLTRQERRIVQAYDAARRYHSVRDVTVASLRVELGALAHDIWVAAHEPGGGGWGIRNRGLRFHLIWCRVRGQQFVR